jgi:hypothetical protein
MRLKEHDKSYRLTFDNGISIEILKRGSEFCGLGEVKLRRRKLRSGELPIMPLIRTPDGCEVSRLELQNVEESKDAVAVTLTPHVSRYGRMEWACCDGEDRWNVGPWEQEAERDRGGALRLTLQAVNRVIGGLEFAGFSYGYKFRSRKCRIYRLHDRATWELGGWATGNSFWMQGPYNVPQKTFEGKRDSFTTAWCRSVGGTVEVQQFLPLFTALQGFAFQFDRQNLLLTAFEAPFHCRSLFQKNAGQNYFIHWHQLCGDLGACLEFPALQVLCANAPCSDMTERADQYSAIRDELQRTYAEQCRLMREGTVVSGRIAAAEGACAEALQRGLDELARAGCKRVYVSSLMGAFAPRDMNAAGAGGRELVQESYRQVSRFVDHAHQRGLEVAASLADCCAPWLIAGSRPEGPQDAAGIAAKPIGDVAGAQLVSLALREKPAEKFLLEHLHRVRRALGVDALFADSVLSGIADQFHRALAPANDAGDTEGGDNARGAAADLDDDGGDIRSLHAPTIGLVAALQRMGYKCPLAGAGGLATACAAVGYQLLCDREFMFRDGVFEFPYGGIVDSGAHPIEAYFRGCANRLSYAAVYDAARGAGGRLASWWRQDYATINKAYHAVREHMESSRLLPEGRGVLWTGADPDVRVLWCYKAFAWAAGKDADVFDVTASRRVELEGGEFTPLALRVYLVQDAVGP